jgi:hypothetical protein
MMVSPEPLNKKFIFNHSTSVIHHHCMHGERNRKVQLITWRRRRRNFHTTRLLSWTKALAATNTSKDMLKRVLSQRRLYSMHRELLGSATWRYVTHHAVSTLVVHGFFQEVCNEFEHISAPESSFVKNSRENSIPSDSLLGRGQHLPAIGYSVALFWRVRVRRT